jgi:deoxyribonuclease V
VLCAVDVHYESERARAACTAFDDWNSAEPAREMTIVTPPGDPYVPGEFFRRELPPVLAVLRALDVTPAVVVIDGHVWLDAHDRPGFGARLHRVLGGTAVVGVAKTRYRDAPGAQVLRGRSAKPLFVSAIGLELEEAAEGIRRMHGDHRIPTLLKHADRLARGLLTPRH